MRTGSREYRGSPRQDPQPLSPALTAGMVFASASGYPIGSLGVGAASPFVLTAVRLALAAAAAGCIAWAGRAAWPRGQLLLHCCVAGLLGQCVHFAGLYAGLAAGVPAAVSALVFGLHPVVTAALTALVFRTRLRWQQLLGLGLGIAAVVSALAGRLAAAGPLDAGSALTLLGLLGLAGSAVYQQRFCTGVDLKAATAIQLSVAVPPLAVLAVLEDGGVSDWHSAGLVVLWLVVVNSVIGTRLILEAVSRSGAARASTAFSLVPPTAAVLAWPILGQTPDAGAYAGLALGIAATLLGAGRPGLRQPQVPAPASESTDNPAPPMPLDGTSGKRGVS
ncbi:DMT family transporter [Streptomyces sp. NPDC020719]|uniref:DMT family transporter n=1 Tax=unclassified Streptomyces TaxID=2593676 RepID=UPI0033F1412C